MKFDGKNILVTGGTGSFGKQFINYLLSRYNMNKIVVYSRDEFKQDLTQKELVMRHGAELINDKLRFFIGDVRDADRLKRAFVGIDFIVHAAALKQVPACEYNPFEAIKTNIQGAQNIIEAALERNVKRIVALSTDKAVNPINLYGGTKLVSDKLFCAANSYSGAGDTRFSIVRYGNVSGSRGSIIPYFKQLLESGCKELPITDERMTRFWMTLDDAVKLVVKAFEESKGGETFVYKNPSYKVVDIAEALNPGGKIKIVGIREGEKLHECMITKDDSRTTYDYGDYYIIYPQYNWWNANYLKPSGKLVDQNWEYHSSTNAKWLNTNELRKKMKELEFDEYIK